MLGPIPPREGAARACASQLRTAILRGELAAGSRLPPERSLAETLGVNRATVRAALHELEASGLVTARQGSGYAVHDYRDAGGPDLVGPLADIAREEGRLPEVAGDVLAVRRHLARAVLERLAGRKATRAATEKMSAAIDAFEATAQAGGSATELAECDLAVLGALLDATGSPVLRLFFNPAAGVLARMPELAAAMYAAPLENVGAWRVVLELVRAGTLEVEPVVATLAARDVAIIARLRRATR